MQFVNERITPFRFSKLEFSQVPLLNHREHLHVHITGEFEDSALLTTFGRAGLGLFPAPSVLGDEIAAQFRAEPIGVLSEVTEQYYAISNERRIRHPAVEAIRKAPVSWSPPT